MFSLNCKGKLLLIEKPLVMGILNLTEDSFFPGSRMKNADAIKKKAVQMMEEGAAILDIGAQSTRPGSQRISAAEELEKLLPAIEMLSSLMPEIILSVDTYHSFVAKEAVAAGCSIVNDISGGEMDKNMLPAVGALNVPFVCMHMKGVPETMQDQSIYNDVTLEVLDYFIKKISECQQAGINDTIIDPGFGFAKNISQNFLLLKNLHVFKILEKPVLVGLSRKSTIYKTLKTDAENSLNGTTVLNTLALNNGASILRVHDVKQAMEAVELWKAYEQS